MLNVVIPEKVSEELLRQFPEYPSAIVQLLANRNLLTQQAVDVFLNPEYHELHDPFLFRDMQKACGRIYEAIRNGQKIAIHGDYDADGVTASVILQNTLDLLGAKTMVYLPHRDKEGYGMNLKTIEYLHGQNARLIITCDCGISNVAETAEAKKHGIDTIITDHHQIPETLPDAYAIIHPKIVEDRYPFKYLAGGGVAFKLMQGLLRHTSCTLDELQKETHEKWHLDLVALSTVADMVELVGENRILVKFGLMVMRKNKRIGLQKLYVNARIDTTKIDAQTIGFQIAPRINAAGRMDHANAAYMLLRATEDAEATRLALILEQQNKDRQALTERMYKDALSMTESQIGSILIFYRKEWTAGLAGLLAGKLSKNFNKPVLIMGFDGTRIVGSGRAPDGVNIMSGILSIQDLLISFGGHPQACGYRFEEKNMDEVNRRLNEFFDKALSVSDQTKTISAECELAFTDISWDFLEYVLRFAPFGQANPAPIFYSQNVRIDEIRSVGKKMNHRKMRLTQNGRTMPAIGFNLLTEYGVGEVVDIVFAVSLNEWNGNREIQIEVKNIGRNEANSS